MGGDDAKRGAVGPEEHRLERSLPLSFRGIYSHSLDAKGRVSFPAEFRSVLAEAGERSVVFTNYISDGARCLEGFQPSAWAQFEARLRQQSRFNSKLQKLENYYINRAAECELDSTGRVLIPPHLRTYAGLTRDVTFTSSIHGFRVWDSRVWEVVFRQAEEALMENPDLFAEVESGASVESSRGELGGNERKS